MNGKDREEIFKELDNYANLDEKTTKNYFTDIDEKTTEIIDSNRKISNNNFIKNNKILSFVLKKKILSDEQICELLDKQKGLACDVYNNSTQVLKQRVENNNLDNPEYLETLKFDIQNIARHSKMQVYDYAIDKDLEEIKNIIKEKNPDYKDEINRELLNKVAKDTKEKDKIEYNFDNISLLNRVNSLSENDKEKKPMLQSGIENKDVKEDNPFIRNLQSEVVPPSELAYKDSIEPSREVITKEVTTIDINVGGER